MGDCCNPFITSLGSQATLNNVTFSWKLCEPALQSFMKHLCSIFCCESVKSGLRDSFNGFRGTHTPQIGVLQR